MQELIVDFHIHSHYSRATSKLLTPEHLEYWAKIKGINVVATGDISHPLWLKELEKKLEPAEDGLFKLKDEFRLNLPVFSEKPVRFILSGEISNIYKRENKVRKLHNVVLMPDFATVRKFQQELTKRNFNILSDGRPILGWDARNLLQLTLDINPDNFFIPAHIWTPWFSALGSKSGFDSIYEAFGELTKYIYAVETGLSSNPPMNWMCSFLDDFRLLSNSDAHSPERLGRNANIFATRLSYKAILEALKQPNSSGFAGTIDMYPQEGKYHFDGHRKCGVCFSPVETLEHHGICPVCGKPLTLGVSYRVAQLANRSDLSQRPNRKPFYSYIPLPEILAELNGVGEKSKKVQKAYFELIGKFGSELDILHFFSLSEIEQKGGAFLAEAIRRMRQGEVIISEGFDGQYGKVKLFSDSERKEWGGQLSFLRSEKTAKRIQPDRSVLHFDILRFSELKKLQNSLDTETKIQSQGLNLRQLQAVQAPLYNVAVVAAAGTGKTKVLTRRVAYLIQKYNFHPSEILVITFTRKAAQELNERLKTLLGDKCEQTEIATFHAWAYSVITKNYSDFGFSQVPLILSTLEQQLILQSFGLSENEAKHQLAEISKFKNLLDNKVDTQILNNYVKYCGENNLIDTGDLLFLLYRKWSENPQLVQNMNYKAVLVDEFQDTNKLQYLILKLLQNVGAFFFVIGDPYQSIYRFRGSYPAIFKHFMSDFKATQLSLEITYRCTVQILHTAESLFNKPYEVKAVKQGQMLKLWEFPSENAQAEAIARQIEEMIGGLRYFSIDSSVARGEAWQEINSLGDFAVLCRSRNQFAAFETAFKRHSIPYEIVGGDDKVEYYRQVFILLLKIFTGKLLPFGEVSSEYGIFLKNNSLSDAFQQSNFKEFVAAFLLQISDLQDAQKWQLEQNLTLCNRFSDCYHNLDFFENQTFSSDKVRLITVHAAKGLEFQTVFIPSLNQGVFPLGFGGNIQDIEEEKRLFYVALTRSKNYVFLSYLRWKKPSEFFSFFDPRFIEKEQIIYNKRNIDGTELSLF